jgi:hypothetical protein
MQLLENNSHITHCQCLKIDPSRHCAEGVRSAASKRLLVLLGSGLAIAGAPALLDPVTNVAFAALSILLDIGRVSLVAYQIFGR